MRLKRLNAGWRRALTCLQRAFLASLLALLGLLSQVTLATESSDPVAAARDATADELQLQWKRARSETGEDSLSALAALRALAGHEILAGRHEHGLAWWSRVLLIEGRTLNPTNPARALTLTEIGNAYLAMGNFGAARASFSRALALRESALGPAHPAVAESLNDLGVVAAYERDSTRALPLFQRSLAIREAALGRRHEKVAESLSNLGSTLSALGDAALARPLIEQALEIKEALFGSDHIDLASTLNHLARWHQEFGDPRTARPLFERCLAIRTRVLGAKHADVGIALNNLARNYRDLGEYALELKAAERSLHIALQNNGERHPAVAQALNILSSAHLALGDKARALDLQQRALALRRELLGPLHLDVAFSLSNLASVHLARGDYEAAEADAESAMQLLLLSLGERHLTVANVRASLGIIHALRGNTGAGVQAHLASLSVRSQLLPAGHGAIAQSLHNLAVLRADMGDVKAAIALWTHALPMTWTAGDGHTLSRMLPRLAVAWADAGHRELALFWGRQAVLHIQGQRTALRVLDPALQRNFASEKRRAFVDLAKWEVASSRPEAAEQVMALLKDEEYFDFLGRDPSAAVPPAALPAIPARQAKLHEEWQAFQREATNRATEVAVLQAGLRTGSLDTERRNRLQVLQDQQAALRGDATRWLVNLGQLLQTSPSDLPASKSAPVELNAPETPLPPGTAAVQYVVGEQSLLILLRTEQGRQMREVALARRDLHARISSFRRALQDTQIDPRASGAELFGWLMGPIHQALEAAHVDTLELHVDDVLRYLPFAALVHDGRYLVERYALVLANANRSSEKSSGAAQPWRATGLGVTRGLPERQLEELPSVRSELASIVQPALMPGEVYLDDSFTLERLSESIQTPVLHVASHFRFVPNSDQSFLLIGGNRVVTLRELRRLAPRFDHVQLLTLSACETAMGTSSSAQGIEVEGLSTLLQRLGARAVLATLWAVDDGATASWMQTFYSARVLQGLGNAQAMRHAQLTFLAESRARSGTLAERAHPYFWAPFVLTGNPR